MSRDPLAEMRIGVGQTGFERASTHAPAAHTTTGGIQPRDDAVAEKSGPVDQSGSSSRGTCFGMDESRKDDSRSERRRSWFPGAVAEKREGVDQKADAERSAEPTPDGPPLKGDKDRFAGPKGKGGWPRVKSGTRRRRLAPGRRCRSRWARKDNAALHSMHCVRDGGRVACRGIAAESAVWRSTTPFVPQGVPPRLGGEETRSALHSMNCVRDGATTRTGKCKNTTPKSVVNGQHGWRGT